MLGILIALLISWGLLYLFDKKSLLVLGIRPNARRMKEFGLGFLITASLCFILQYFESYLKASNWTINTEIHGRQIFRMFQWNLVSVVTEELIFRGALLYVLIKKLGPRNGIIITSVAFGVYHWFSLSIIGNIVPMIVIFIGSAVMGWAFALAFSKTESMFMPIGLHFGWNFTLNTIFSKGPLGKGVLISIGGEAISDWFSLIALWLIPVLILLFVSRFVKANRRVIGQD